jgi:hypothetical protein
MAPEVLKKNIIKSAISGHAVLFFSPSLRICSLLWGKTGELTKSVIKGDFTFEDPCWK